MTDDVPCQCPDLPPSFSTDATVAICPTCGALWEIRDVTEMDCETIGGEPVPGTWRHRDPVRAWYRQMSHEDFIRAFGA